MELTKSILPDFVPIQLNDLDRVQLLNRKDTKFIFLEINLPAILERIHPHYHILEIDGNYSFEYDNEYFDTDNLLLYNQHHNEKRKRYKVRFRRYSPTNKQYFEIKIKTNKNRTAKKRIEVDEVPARLKGKFGSMVEDLLQLSPNEFSPKINIHFSRITLADINFQERLTIDTNLSVKNGVSSKIFNDLVITEIKQSKYNPRSEFMKVLREMRIPEMRFSKYCMGILHVYKDVKYNRFKPKLQQLNKLTTNYQQGILN